MNSLESSYNFPCALRAWSQNQQVLMQWLLKRTQDKPLTEDIAQEVFIKVMKQREQFCAVANPKAWIFRVAKNLLIDHLRRDQPLPIETDPVDEFDTLDSVDQLAETCLPRVISELDENSRAVIMACDIEGLSQQAYADQYGLSLSATKSRLRRARLKLKDQIQCCCQVKFDEEQKICCFTPREDS